MVPVSVDRTVADAAERNRADVSVTTGAVVSSTNVTDDDDAALRLPAASVLYSTYSPDVSPDVDAVNGVFAVFTVPEFQRLPAAEVMLATSDTLTVFFTRYHEPASVL